MKTGLQIQADRCLLIFDSHEDAAWVRSVIERERGDFDHLLLGGDYFDSAEPPEGGGVAAMCALIQSLPVEFAGRITMLLGNHDISYLAARPNVLAGRKPRPAVYPNSGFKDDSAVLITRLVEPGWWSDRRLFQVVNGVLVSHAGLAARFWPARPTLAASLEALQEQASAALADLERPHLLLGVGPARRGSQPIGGITWLDFSDEFRDELPLPQVFGHTASRAGARRCGRSWCLDGHQTCYGILRRDGSLEIKSTAG